MTVAHGLSLNTATVKAQWTLAQAIDGCARHGFEAIAPWRDVLADLGVDKARRQIRDAGLAVTGLCRGGMFTQADHAAMLDDNRRAIDDAATLEAACLVLVVGGIAEGSRDLAGARSRVADVLAELLPHARAAGIPLAIEPLHPMYAADRACVNTLGQALDLCDRLGPGLGVAVDVYHVWWDPELAAQIARAGPERLLAFHICDWLRTTTDLLFDRGMMGDGVVDIRGIDAMVRATGFAGPAEVEIFSAANWWLRDPDEVLATVKSRAALALATAEDVPRAA